MRSRKSKNTPRNLREQLLELCGEIHEDDCVDPKHYFRPSRNLDQADKKARQLCRQAVETLGLVLADCDDELMHSLFVASARPGADGSRLLVSIGVDRSPSQFDRALILSRLQLQIPRLRGELARSMTRKRVPNLEFNLFLKDTSESDLNSQTEFDPENFEQGEV